jgi:hypothetical protein
MFGTYSKSRACLILAAAFLAGWASPSRAQETEPATAEPLVLAQAQGQAQPRPAPPGIRERMNAWTIGLASGLLEGAPLRFTAEIARALNDGDEMRVIPMVTRGVGDNLKDLLYLRGVDAAIIYGDSLSELSGQPEVQRKVNYIASLFPAELHVLARPDIRTLQDLNGKTVNFNTKGTPAAYTGPIIFDKLNIKAKYTFNPHPVVAREMMSGKGDCAAVVLLSSKPLDAFAAKKWPAGFHFLPVPYSIRLGQYYLPSALKDTDYPNLIAKGEQVPTLAVPAVLAAFDWPRGSDRYRRMERFVQYLFARLTILQTQPGYHPKWKDVNLAAKVPGWDRFPPVQAELDKVSSPESLDRFRAQAARALPDDPAEQERLFQEFVKWANDPAVRQRAGR